MWEFRTWPLTYKSVRILRKKLRLTPYKLHLHQALSVDDKQARANFCIEMQARFEVDDFADRLIFSNEATFHVSGKVNRHNVRIWGTENPNAIIEHVRDSPKVNVFCAISKLKVYGPFFFFYGAQRQWKNIPRHAAKKSGVTVG